MIVAVVVKIITAVIGTVMVLGVLEVHTTPLAIMVLISAFAVTPNKVNSGV